MPDEHYPDTADGLRQLWLDIVAAAQRDDRERVHQLMQTLAMTDEDLVALFGDELGSYLKPRYRPMITRMVNVGSLELVAQIIERKYDDAEVIPMVEGSPDVETRASLAVLKVKTPVYAVRVKKKSETRGLRYDFFVFHRGRWVTGNQFARFFAPPRDTTNTSTGVALPSPTPAGSARPKPGGSTGPGPTGAGQAATRAPGGEAPATRAGPRGAAEGAHPGAATARP